MSQHKMLCVVWWSRTDIVLGTFKDGQKKWHEAGRRRHSLQGSSLTQVVRGGEAIALEDGSGKGGD